MPQAQTKSIDLTEAEAMLLEAALRHVHAEQNHLDSLDADGDMDKAAESGADIVEVAQRLLALFPDGQLYKA